MAVLGRPNPTPKVLSDLMRQPDWCAAQCISTNVEGIGQALNQFDIAVLVDQDPDAPNTSGLDINEINRLAELLKNAKIGCIALTRRPWLFGDGDVRLVCLPFDAEADVARGAIMALSQMRPFLRQFEMDKTSMRLLSRRLQRHFAELDHELRLAARLQKEFLPRELPRVGPITFRSIFRPTSFVSGDIFDAFRLDEQHVGFYLADAVGHGVAAGLLTMYIKNAIRPKRIQGDHYELVPPGEVLSELNNHLVAQQLPDSQFVTAWYGLINTETLELRFAVAGHPNPLLVDPTADLVELGGDGCLLGVFPDQPYRGRSVQLKPGQRVVVYSDGLEPTLIVERVPGGHPPLFAPGITEILRQPPDQLVSDLLEKLDTAPGGLANADDVSMLMLEVGDRASNQ